MKIFQLDIPTTAFKFIMIPKKIGKKVTNELKSQNINNFTFAPKSQKTYAYVIKGLDQNLAVDEIKNILDSENFKIKEVFKMKTQFRPLFLVVSTSFFKITNLNKNYKYILNTKISWERKRNEKSISQCHRCQAWSHAATYCNMAARCLKCTAKHLRSFAHFWRAIYVIIYKLTPIG